MSESLVGEPGGNQRLAFVFRWLALCRRFHADASKQHAIKMSPDMRKREAVRLAKARKKRSGY
jgi:hypothetical protein